MTERKDRLSAKDLEQIASEHLARFGETSLYKDLKKSAARAKQEELRKLEVETNPVPQVTGDFSPLDFEPL